MFSLRKLMYGSASNVLRLFCSVLITFLLPPLLARHLSQAQYSAWVLILQLSAYIALLDGGLQQVVAKLIAEHHAAGDLESGGHVLSSSVSLMAGIAAVGMAVVSVLVWRVPQLFHQMPATLVSPVRVSLLLIGASAAFALPFNPFLAVFTGLQEYGFPTVVALGGRLLSAVLMAVMVLEGKSLVSLAVVLTVTNILTAFAQWGGWLHLASSRVRFSAFSMDRRAAKLLLRSGGVLALWTLGGLFVSGLDTMIVGRYDYGNTGFYSVGANATNFMLLSVAALFSPLLPAVSAMQVNSEASALGALTIRSTRLCTMLLCGIALLLIVFAYPLLSLWMGPVYAVHSTLFLRWLVIGNLIRQLGLPYSTVVIATGKQHFASIATLAEAVVNVSASLWLMHFVGAVGVAYGTVIGSLVSVGLHMTVSMRATRSVIAMSPLRFLFGGILRPLLCVTPALFLIPFLSEQRMLPAPLPVLAPSLFGIVLLFLFAGLTRGDRAEIALRVDRLRAFMRA